MIFQPGGVRPGPLAFITLTVLLDTMGFGLIITVLPTLVAELGNVPMDRAATVGGALIMTYAMAQFLFSPVIGGLSDAHGRRPVLLVSMVGFSASMLVAGLATSLWMLFAGRILAGITGASYSTATAYMADVTPPEKRAQTFGLIGVAFGMGLIIGPAVGGLLGGIDIRWPFFAAAALAGVNILMGLFLLPESLPPERRRPFDPARANPSARSARSAGWAGRCAALPSPISCGCWQSRCCTACGPISPPTATAGLLPGSARRSPSSACSPSS